MKNRLLKKNAKKGLAKLQNSASLPQLKKIQRANCKTTHKLAYRTKLAVTAICLLVCIVAVTVPLGVLYKAKQSVAPLDPISISAVAEGNAFDDPIRFGEIYLPQEPVAYYAEQIEVRGIDFPFYYEEISYSDRQKQDELWQKNTLKTVTTSIYDISSANANSKDIHLFSDDTTDGIILTKWMFWYLFRKDLLPDYDKLLIEKGKQGTFLQKVLSDKYCMEKVNVDILSLIHPETGKSVRQYSEEEIAALDLATNEKSDAFLEFYANNPIVSNRTELSMAALARYGVIDFRTFEYEEKAIRVKLKTTTGQTVTKDLRIIGYVETAADKLLSTGVPMDENSEEYQTVLSQLQAPVIYSMCGNVFSY